MRDDNLLRQQRGQRALVFYNEQILKAGGQNLATDDLIDLLADLRHYCASAGIDFDAADEVAVTHFEAERGTA